MLRVGEAIGHIRIEKPIGAGGMGEVFLGFDEKLLRPVAVKVLAPHARLSPASKARFLQEARLLSRLDHPGICRIYDYFEEAGQEFLLLEYIEGQNLREAVGDLSETQLLSLMADAADALAAAHREGVIHRDLKPENMMVTPAGEVKILDFGIARSLEAPVLVEKRRREPKEDVGPSLSPPPELEKEKSLTIETIDLGLMETRVEGSTSGQEAASEPLTKAGTILGTVRFMSPEQAGGVEVGPAGDMYSFGILLHELLSGRSPYGEAKGMALLLKVFRAETEAVRGLDSDLSRLIEDLERIDPADRPGAEETGRRLRWIVDKPLRRRRKKIRTLTLGAIITVIVVSASVAVYSRLMAGRRASVAQRFSSKAKEMEWQLRVEHLCPPHDLRPAERAVRQQMKQLGEEMDEIGPIAKGPGYRALGAASLALGDIGSARHALEKAWEAGEQSPETAYLLGLSLGRQYQEELRLLKNTGSPESRAEAFGRLETEYKEPALEYLRNSRSSPVVFPDFLEGLIALYEERFDDALNAAARIGSDKPWFYEAEVLKATVYYEKSLKSALVEKDLRGELENFELASAALRRALKVGRSDPDLQLSLCRIDVYSLRARMRLNWRGLDDRLFDSVLEECRDVLAMEPDRVDAMAHEALLLEDRASLARRRGEDEAPLEAKAFELVRKGLELEPANRWVRGVQGWIFYSRAFRKLNKGREARGDFDAAITNFQVLVSQADAPAYARLNLADSYFGRAVCELIENKDPSVFLKRGIEVAEIGLRLAPGSSSLLATMGNLYCILGRHRAAHGGEAIPAFEHSISSYADAAKNSSDPEIFRNLALVQTDLGDALLGKGGDAESLYRKALVSADRAINLNPDYGLPQLVKGLAYLGLARAARLDGEDPSPALNQARQVLHEAQELRPDLEEIALHLIEADLEQAEYQIEQGVSPKVALSSVLEALDSEPASDSLDRKRLKIRGYICAADWEIKGERRPHKLLEEVTRLGKEVFDSGESGAEDALALARIHLLKASLLREDVDVARQEIADGLEMASAALKINPLLAEAEGVRAELMWRLYQLTGYSEDLSLVREAMKKANQLNPKLRIDMDGFEDIPVQN